MKLKQPLKSINNRHLRVLSILHENKVISTDGECAIKVTYVYDFEIQNLVSQIKMSTRLNGGTWTHNDIITYIKYTGFIVRMSKINSSSEFEPFPTDKIKYSRESCMELFQ